jgi:glycosyltransferase involved in cell wall biosynthesis
MKEIYGQPLVSVVVVTYNSSQYILETLESAKNQTYQNLELIISDDCSSDSTLEICREWINKNTNRFIRIELIETFENTGITANCYRGYSNTRGEWVKIIAGDDILENKCIVNYFDFVSCNSDVMVVQGNSKYYKDSFSESNYLRTRKIMGEVLMKIPLSVKFQRKVLLYSPAVNAPTLFINRKYIESIGYMDDRVPFMEDWPLWIKINNSKTLIHGLDEVTVKYRVNSSSISNNGSIVNRNFEELYKFQREFLWSELSVLDKLFINYEFFIKKMFSKYSVTSSNRFFKISFLLLISPVLGFSFLRNNYYYYKFKVFRG